MQAMQILVLGPEGAGRSALVPDPHAPGLRGDGRRGPPDRLAPASGDIVMLDLRGEDADWGELAAGLQPPTSGR